MVHLREILSEMTIAAVTDRQQHGFLWVCVCLALFYRSSSFFWSPLEPLILMTLCSTSLRGCWTRERTAGVTAWSRRPTSVGWFILPWTWSDTEAHLQRCRQSLQPAPEGPRPQRPSPAGCVISPTPPLQRASFTKVTSRFFFLRCTLKAADA